MDHFVSYFFTAEQKKVFVFSVVCLLYMCFFISAPFPRPSFFAPIGRKVHHAYNNRHMMQNQRRFNSGQTVWLEEFH